jgi:uncharacterized membrane protein YqjE
MDSETTRFRTRAGDAGLFNSFVALISALAGFFQSRTALIAKESKAAVVQCIILAVFLAAALVLFALGYLFLVVSVIAGIAHAAQVSWAWIALAAAGVHFLIALFCLLIVRSKLTRPMFRATAAELKKDAEWLKTLDATNRSRN